MCLTVRRKGLVAPRKARRDIAVNKLLVLGKGGKLYSPFVARPVEEKRTVEGNIVMEAEFTGDMYTNYFFGYFDRLVLSWPMANFPPKVEKKVNGILVGYTPSKSDGVKKNHMQINGGIHSFGRGLRGTRKDVLEWATSWRWAKRMRDDEENTEVIDEPDFPSFVIYRAIIPKGAYYYKGQEGDYVSTKLILKKVKRVCVA